MIGISKDFTKNSNKVGLRIKHVRIKRAQPVKTNTINDG